MPATAATEAAAAAPEAPAIGALTPSAAITPEEDTANLQEEVAERATDVLAPIVDEDRQHANNPNATMVDLRLALERLKSDTDKDIAVLQGDVAVDLTKLRKEITKLRNDNALLNGEGDIALDLNNLRKEVIKLRNDVALCYAARRVL